MQRPSSGPGFEARQPGSGRATLRALRYLRRYWLDTLGALLAVLLVSAANLAVPRLIQLAIDRGVGERERGLLVVAVAGIVAAAAARGLFTFVQNYLAERASQRVAYDLRDALFAKIERLSFSYFDRVETGQLVTRLTNDVEQVRTFIGAGVVQLVSALVMLIGTAVLLLVLNWQLALVALATIPIIMLTLLGFVRRIGPVFGAMMQSVGAITTVLQEDLTGLRTIRAYGREAHEEARYARTNQELLDRAIQAIRLFAGNFPNVFLIANLGTLAVVWVGGRQVIDGGLSVGELIAFNAYLNFLLFPVLTIGFLAAQLSRAGASALRVFEVLDEPEDVTDAPGAIALPPVAGAVRFEGVGFRYPGDARDTLSEIDFAVEPGTTVAIIGTTGSGKTTLVNLIPRFYDVTSGRITIDGHDVRDVTVASLRAQIGVVLQDALLFSGSVRDNIAFGRPDASDAAVESAARAAQADGFIRALPNGYATLVGERGVGLSGGQRQRIAIARALLVDPRLLILDDSTSAVDVATEAAIREALDALIRDGRRTVFVIAHRIATVRDADLILVLDEGRIVARGSHAELLRDSEIYNEIVRSQLLAGEESIAAAVGGGDG